MSSNLTFGVEFKGQTSHIPEIMMDLPQINTNKTFHILGWDGSERGEELTIKQIRDRYFQYLDEMQKDYAWDEDIIIGFKTEVNFIFEKYGSDLTATIVWGAS